MHTAPWVVPVSRPPIAGGGAAVAAGRIVAVDEAGRLSQRFPGIPVEDHPDCALTPALVNAHTHLELSHLAGLTGEPYPGSFTAWISRLLQWRDWLGATGEAAGCRGAFGLMGCARRRCRWGANRWDGTAEKETARPLL